MRATLECLCNSDVIVRSQEHWIPSGHGLMTLANFLDVIMCVGYIRVSVSQKFLLENRFGEIIDCVRLISKVYDEFPINCLKYEIFHHKNLTNPVFPQTFFVPK